MTMAPKRFKAVCTETGREFFPDRQGLDRNNPPWLVRKTRNLYSWAVQAWIPIKHTKIELCQSTGLTDAKGREVYEWDVILVYFPRTDSGYVYSVFFDRGGFKLEGFYFLGQERPGGQRHWLGIDVLLDAIEDGARLYCVGNRWMPQAELQARADAVSDR